MIKDSYSPSSFDLDEPDNLTYHKPEIISNRRQRLSGFCNGGHLFRFHGFIDSQGVWRCKKCRKEANDNRKFFRLVEQYQKNPTDELLKQIEAFQKIP